MDLQKIITIVESHYLLQPGDIQLVTRKREIVQARQVSMYFAKMKTLHTLSIIGSYNGGKDHATVLHACKTITNLIETDKAICKDIAVIESKITLALRSCMPKKVKYGSEYLKNKLSEISRFQNCINIKIALNELRSTL
jgi:hypothetical protein